MSASSESERMPSRQLGELMTELGLISDEQLATVLEVQQRSERPLGQIIVELGFASGAAVAHALAMQSGGALRTEYGFALGVHPEHGEGDGSRAGLPKLRLAATAVAPPVRADDGPATDAETEPAQEESLEADADGGHVEDEVEAAALEIVPELEDLPTDEPEEAAEPEPEEAEEDDGADEADASADTPLDVEPEPEPEPEPVELEQLRAEIERLEAALLEDRTAAVAERERLQAEVARLETALAEETEREQELARLRQEHDHATSEIGRLETALAEAQTNAAEHERRLAEEQERHTTGWDELTAERDRLHQELGEALERLGADGAAVEERDGLRAEVERLEATLVETQDGFAAERERLLTDVDRLQSAIAATYATHQDELEALRREHEKTQAELDSLQTALAEAQTVAAEQERRLADEHERHAGERDELTAQRDRLQEELGGVLERLAVVGPAAEERDELRAEVEQLRAAGAEAQEAQEAHQAEIRSLAEARDTVTAELTEAREMLVQAERLRESQIALTAERDRALAELERIQAVAAESQEAAEEQTRLLAEEQDRHQADVESLLAQRTLLEQELGGAIEQLAAAAADADAREEQLQLGSQRLVDALDAVKQLAAELVSSDEQFAEATPNPSDPEPETAAENEPTEEPTGYSLFVPSPTGYDLVPQTGVPPQPGDTVEVTLPDRDEPVLFEVVRSGRTLPDGDVCVYLAQV